MGRKRQSYKEFLAGTNAERVLNKFREQEFWRFEYTKRKFLLDLFYSATGHKKEDKLPHLDEKSIGLMLGKMRALYSVIEDMHSQESAVICEGIGEEIEFNAVLNSTSFEDSMYSLYKASSIEDMNEMLSCDLFLSAVFSFHKWKFGDDPKYAYDADCRVRGFSIDINEIEDQEYLAAVEELHKISMRYGFFPWEMMRFKPMDAVYISYRDEDSIENPAIASFLKIRSCNELFVDANFKAHDGIQYFSDETKGNFYCYFQSLSEAFELAKEVKKSFLAYRQYKKRPKQKSVYGDSANADIQVVISKEFCGSDPKSLEKRFCKTVTDKIVAYRRWYHPAYIPSKESVLSIESALITGRDQTFFGARCLGLWMWDKVVFDNVSKADAMRDVLKIKDPKKSDQLLFEFRRSCDDKQLRRDFSLAQLCVEEEKVVTRSK